MDIPSTQRGRGAPPKMTTRVADNAGAIIFEDVNDNEGIRRINSLEKAGEFGPDALHTSEDYTADLNRMFKDVNGKSFSDLWQEDPKQAIPPPIEIANNKTKSGGDEHRNIMQIKDELAKRVQERQERLQENTPNNIKKSAN